MNKVVISAAGSGKTTRIVREILDASLTKVLIVTYTLNNVSEIKKKFYEVNGSIPSGITIIPWFTFLLQDFVRPYQNMVCNEPRISSINFVNGKSVPYTKKTDIRYFLDKDNRIYTDKISEFGFSCDQATKGLSVGRIEMLYSHIYIDEVQDLAGYDLNILEILLKSNSKITLVGDHRQATFQTNYSKMNSAYAGRDIIKKFIEWEKKGLCEIHYSIECFRCNQIICDFADLIYPDLPKTKSNNLQETGHDGIFVINSKDVDLYIMQHSPQILRYDKRTPCGNYNALNFGDSKGLTFDRVLVLPNGPISKFLTTGNFEHISSSAAKFYVGVTRARFSLTFVFNGPFRLDMINYEVN